MPQVQSCFGTHTANLNVRVTMTDLEITAMNLQDEDIGAGIFIWSMLSVLTLSLTAIGGWALSG